VSEVSASLSSRTPPLSAAQSVPLYRGPSNTCVRKSPLRRTNFGAGHLLVDGKQMSACQAESSWLSTSKSAAGGMRGLNGGNRPANTEPCEPHVKRADRRRSDEELVVEVEFLVLPRPRPENGAAVGLGCRRRRTPGL